MQRVKHIFVLLTFVALSVGLPITNLFAMSDTPPTKPVILTDQTIPANSNAVAPLSSNQFAFNTPKIFRPIYQDRKPIKIAILLPLTGTYADLGNALLDAAQLAIFDINSPSLTILPLDTKGTVLGATRAAKKAVEEGAVLILGPVFSNSAKAIAPIGYENDINIISFSNDESLVGEGIFLLGFSPKQQIKRVVDFAINQGVSFFSSVVPNNRYGAMVSESLRNQVEKNEGYVKNVEFYLSDKTNIRRNISRSVSALMKASREREERLREIAEAKAKGKSTPPKKKSDDIELLQEPDYKALLIPEGGDRLRNIAASLERYDLKSNNIRLLGSGQWDDNSVAEIPLLQGSWFASAPPEQRKRFESHFQNTYGYLPVRLASLAYDGVALAAALASVADGGDFTHQAITNKRGFVGVDGIFRLRPDGITERGLAVLETTAFGFQVVDPAPDSFLSFDETEGWD